MLECVGNRQVVVPRSVGGGNVGLDVSGGFGPKPGAPELDCDDDDDADVDEESDVVGASVEVVESQLGGRRVVSLGGKKGRKENSMHDVCL